MISLLDTPHDFFEFVRIKRFPPPGSRALAFDIVRTSDRTVLFFALPTVAKAATASLARLSLLMLPSLLSPTYPEMAIPLNACLLQQEEPGPQQEPLG